MKDIPLGPGERMLAMERCGTSRETAQMLRACAAGFGLTAVAVVLGIVLPSPARWVALCVALATLVSAIVLGWFAFVRSIDGPRVRAVTSERAIELTRSDELRTIPLARVAAIKAVRTLPDGTRSSALVAEAPEAWAGAVGLELESRDGRRFQMAHQQMAEIGPALVRAIAEQARR